MSNLRYGKLNVGDQILVCDGVNLIDVTHDEAAQALKKAMDMESVGAHASIVLRMLTLDISLSTVSVIICS